MTQRSYRQNCGLAVSLDLLGERWTMLVLRELHLGPKRFGDLLDGLPGIGTNLLAARLKTLTGAGVIEHVVLPPPVRVAAYALTERGRALQPMLEGLALWGFELIADGAPDRLTRGSWILQSMRAVYVADPDPGLALVVDLDVEGELLVVEVDGSKAEVRHAQDPGADLRARLDTPTLLALGAGEQSVAEAVARGGLLLEGDPAALSRLLERFRLPGPVLSPGPA